MKNQNSISTVQLPLVALRGLVLFPNTVTSIDIARDRSLDSVRRAMEGDGCLFAVAQRDLELRGSGDVLGTNQSGLPQFKVGDPIGDLKMLQTARADAGALLAAPHWDEKDENQPLVLYLKRHQLETHFD